MMTHRANTIRIDAHLKEERWVFNAVRNGRCLGFATCDVEPNGRIRLGEFTVYDRPKRRNWLHTLIVGEDAGISQLLMEEIVATARRLHCTEVYGVISLPARSNNTHLPSMYRRFGFQLDQVTADQKRQIVLRLTPDAARA